MQVIAERISAGRTMDKGYQTFDSIKVFRLNHPERGEFFCPPYDTADSIQFFTSSIFMLINYCNVYLEEAFNPSMGCIKFSLKPAD